MRALKSWNTCTIYSSDFHLFAPPWCWLQPQICHHWFTYNRLLYMEDLKEQKQIHISIHIERIIAFWGTSWHDEHCQTHVIFWIIVYAFLITFIFPFLGFNIMIKMVAKFVKTHHMSCMILLSCFALHCNWCDSFRKIY
jgi:hypothetical protein